MNPAPVESSELSARPAKARVGHSDFYNTTITHAASPEELLQGGFTEGIGAIPITADVDLQFFAALRQSETLRVVFHGAVMLDRDRYPRFDRVNTQRAQGGAFLSFADPTLTLGEDITLTWYLGTAEWDPQELILRTVRLAMEKVGATKVIFIGGSGGGFAALKYSALMPESMAFVFSPQTSAPEYNAVRGNHFPTLLERGFPGMDLDEVMAAHPGRFEVVSTYKSGEPANFVYYLQNLNDPSHIKLQYNPMRRALGLVEPMGLVPRGNVLFALYDSEREGHGPPSAPDFDEHYARAHAAWNSNEKKPLSLPERSSTLDLALEQKVAALLDKKVAEIKEHTSKLYRASTREMGFLPASTERLRRVAAELVPPGAPIPPIGSFALRADSVDVLVRAIQKRKPEIVVEAGSGSSTAWMALVLRGIGFGHIYALEHDPEFATRTESLLRNLGVDRWATVLSAPLESQEIDGHEFRWYSPSVVAGLPDVVDIVLVDGPPASTGRLARYPAYPVLRSRMTPDSILLLDDMQRRDEIAMAQRWIDQYPDDELRIELQDHDLWAINVGRSVDGGHN